jgi:hypothetical protein
LLKNLLIKQVGKFYRQRKCKLSAKKISLCIKTTSIFNFKKTIFMNKYGFEINTTALFFRKLIEDHEDFYKDRTSSRVALNCVMTAWHLHEWVYNEYNLSSTYPKLRIYQDYLKVSCPSFQLMQDLANGTKHFKITLYIPKVQETHLHQGGFSSGFSRGFDISMLEIKLDDGSVVDFESQIQNVINFWKGYLPTFGIDTNITI